jgi:hypothetical protein
MLFPVDYVNQFMATYNIAKADPLCFIARFKENSEWFQKLDEDEDSYDRLESVFQFSSTIKRALQNSPGCLADCVLLENLRKDLIENFNTKMYRWD